MDKPDQAPVELHSIHAQEEQVGYSYPLGPTVTPGGTNFSVFSTNATRMEIVFFDDGNAPQPTRIVSLDPILHRTFNCWHIFLPGIKSGQLYGYRADGPDNPADGHRFDRHKVLLDPYGKSVFVGSHYSRAAACAPGDNAATSMKSVLVDLGVFDWEGDRPLNRPFHKTVIYEMHVAGFTRHPNSGVAAASRGTYLGVIEKIPYLQKLGITAVELLPIFQFDVEDAPPGLINYWGYNPISFSLPPTSPTVLPRTPWAAWRSSEPW